MNQEPNKPKLIIKTSLGESTGTDQAAPANSSLPLATETNPITRLGNELFELKEQIKFLTKAIQVIEKRGVPATSTQVEQVLKAAKEGVQFSLDAGAVAQQLAPELEENTKQAVDQIKQATQEAANKMHHHYSWEAKQWRATIGFTSWKSAVSILLTTLVIVVGCIWYAATQYERSSVMQAKLTKSEEDNEFWQKYAAWVDTKDPKLWKTYQAKLDKEYAAKSKQ